MLLKALTISLSPSEVTSPLVAGRLGMLIDTLTMSTSDLWVLQVIKGLRILSVVLPNQDILPTVPEFLPEQAALMKEVLRLLLDSGTRQPRWLLSKSLCCTQEEWPNETNDQPETDEQLGVHRTLQNRVNPKPEGHSTINRLVHENYFIIPIDSNHQQ